MDSGFLPFLPRIDSAIVIKQCPTLLNFHALSMYIPYTKSFFGVSQKTLAPEESCRFRKGGDMGLQNSAPPPPSLMVPVLQTIDRGRVGRDLVAFLPSQVA